MINNHNILDVLNFMFDYIFDIADDKDEIDDITLKNHLKDAGFDKSGIDKALVWLDNISSLQDGRMTTFTTKSGSLRIYTAKEMSKINLTNRNFLYFLEGIGELNPTQRELIISQVMSLEAKDLSFNDFKWVVIMVLSNNDENESSNLWLEAVVLDEHHQTIQ